MDIPYYGNVSVLGENFCNGCLEAELIASTDFLRVWGEKAIVTHTIACSHLAMCKQVYKNTLAKKCQEITEKESEDK